MPPMNPPNAAAPPPDPAQQPVDPAIEKSLTQVMQGLGQLYMACHKADPESPLCDSVMSLQKAVAEIGRTVGAPPEAMDASMDQGAGIPPDAAADAGGPGAPPDPDAGMDLSGVDPNAPMPQGSSIADAAGDTQSMMQDAAKRRLAGK